MLGLFFYEKVIETRNQASSCVLAVICALRTAPVLVVSDRDVSLASRLGWLCRASASASHSANPACSLGVLVYLCCVAFVFVPVVMLNSDSVALLQGCAGNKTCYFERLDKADPKKKQTSSSSSSSSSSRSVAILAQGSSKRI